MIFFIRYILFFNFLGHKFYGPRIGALYHRDLQISPFLLGGGQEGGKRSGTENTPMIAGLGLAAELVRQNLKSYSESMRLTRDQLWDNLSKIEGVRWLSTEPCLPNTLLISIPGRLTGAEIIEKCGGHLLASTGAACHSEKSASAVLTASRSVKIFSTHLRMSYYFSNIIYVKIFKFQSKNISGLIAFPVLKPDVGIFRVLFLLFPSESLSFSIKWGV